MVTSSEPDSQPQVRFGAGQANRTRDLCETIRRVPGMVIAPFNWNTATTFWDGYMHGMDGDPFQDFREWGLQRLGSPGSNLSAFGVLKVQVGLASDGDVLSLPRERATEVAALMCDLVIAYVDEHASADGRMS